MLCVYCNKLFARSCSIMTMFFFQGNSIQSDMAIGGPKEKVILCLGGAFNPVHSRHVMAMVLGKQWLEANTNYQVIAGRLVVAPNGYVKAKSSKSGCKCIKAEHRIKMCELACYPYKEWLATYHHPIGSAAEAGYKTKIDMLRSGDQNQDIIHVAVIVGADRAMNKTGRAKWHKNASHITLCIGRKGETGRIIEQFKKDQDSNKVNNSRFFFVPDELDNVSSTAIRQVLAKLDYDACADTNKTQEIVDTLVTDQWISEKQGVYLVHNLSFLYLT